MVAIKVRLFTGKILLVGDFLVRTSSSEESLLDEVESEMEAVPDGLRGRNRSPNNSRCFGYRPVLGVTGLGIKAGLNIISARSNQAEGLSANAGFIVGGFLDFSFHEIFVLQPEILFSLKGGSDWSINYLEMPVLLKIVIPVAGNV